MATIEIVSPYKQVALDDRIRYTQIKNEPFFYGDIRWIVVYPAYINAKKKQTEGRRVSLIKAGRLYITHCD